MDSKSDILKDAPTGNNGNLRKIDLLWDEKCHSDDWNGLVHGEDIERVYDDRDKAQVAKSLGSLVDDVYISLQ